MSYITEKVHILAVLEDSSPHDAHQVKTLLKEYFDLGPSLDAVRKHLQRCLNQELVTRERNGRRYRYRISGKGRERLKRMRAKRQKETTEVPRSIELQGASERQGKLVRLDPFEKTVKIAALHLSMSMIMEMANMAYTNTIAAKPDESGLEIILVRNRREEGEYAFYRLEQEREERESYKKKYLGEKLKREGVEKELERARARELEACWEGFRLGCEFERERAESRKVIELGKTVSLLLQDRMSRKQKREEAFQAILLRRCINWRWWDLLPSGSKNRLPPVE